ncbi:unknown [Clostridium sp. CAG:356]|nr:unknown [Clostridium sp. CAG:356]
MTNKVLKVMIKIILLMLIIQTIYTSKTEALSLDGIFKAGDNFINEGKTESQKNEAINYEEFRLTTNNIGSVLTTLGIVLAVIIGGILGIQIMWGSIEQQVKAKEMIMPYVVGCIVIFGAFGIWKLAVTIFSQLQ